LLIVAHERCLLCDLLRRDVSVNQELPITCEIDRVARERFLRLAHAGRCAPHRLLALRNREVPGVGGMRGACCIAVRLREVGGKRGLQVGGVERREDLATRNVVALADVDGVGRFRQGRLNCDVLIRGDEPR